MGEVKDQHAVTLRTSIIGHELQTKTGLIEWFLSQDDECRCYTRSFFSGFPTIVLARLIKDYILPKHELYGVYHIASERISKFDLLKLVAKRYGKSIKIIPDKDVVIDRSLCADRFESSSGYIPPNWPSLIDSMYSNNLVQQKNNVQR